MKILFVATGLWGEEGSTGRLAPFQQADLDLLRDLGYEVRDVLWRGRPVLRLLRGARWADLVYCWNISDHAFFASFAAKKLACVVGGYEFANLPEYHYGNLISKRMRAITKWVWRNADALLYVDPSLSEEATQAFGHPGNGYYVPTGYDHDYWTPNDARRRDIVITVCHVPTVDRLKLKGVDLFFEAARMNPDIEFHIAGDVPESALRPARSPNIRIHGWLDADQLREFYRQAKVYCQMSLHEGLPNAVCEAMLCGCVPVGVAVNGIPTAIGDTGFIVERKPESVSEGIRAAMASDQLKEKAR